MTSTSVKAAIDTDGTTGLADDPAFAAAADAIDGDHIGFVYVDLEARHGAARWRRRERQSGAPAGQRVACWRSSPTGSASGLRVESDALVMDARHAARRARLRARRPTAPTRSRAGRRRPRSSSPPATTSEPRCRRPDRPCTRTSRASRTSFAGIDQAAGVLGGVDAAIGWIGRRRASSSARTAPPSRAASSSSRPTPDGATQLLTTLRSFVVAGRRPRPGITVRDEDYNGTTITIIDLGSAQDLVGMAGALGGGTLPTDPSTMPLPGGQHRARLRRHRRRRRHRQRPRLRQERPRRRCRRRRSPTRPATATSSARVGAEHTGVTFVDIAAIRGIVEGLMSSATAPSGPSTTSRSSRSSSPFDAFVAASAVGDDLDTQTRHHHRQVARSPGAPDPARTPAQRRHATTHGSPHPIDARRRAQAADLSRRRRRRPQRPRRSSASRRSATTTRAASRSSSSSTPTRPRRGSRRAPSRPTPSPDCSAQAGILPAGK